MRDENLDTAKSYIAVGLEPRSPRMQYGPRSDARTDATHPGAGGRQRRPADRLYAEPRDSAPDANRVYVFNKKYYRVCRHQFEASWAYVNRGFAVERIPVSLRDWRVAPEDGHLNAQATDLVMANLALRLRPAIASRSIAKLVLR